LVELRTPDPWQAKQFRRRRWPAGQQLPQIGVYVADGLGELGQGGGGLVAFERGAQLVYQHGQLAGVDRGDESIQIGQKGLCRQRTPHAAIRAVVVAPAAGRG
jgi:hypothetical protein